MIPKERRLFEEVRSMASVPITTVMEELQALKAELQESL